jgi:phage-related protein
MTDRPIILYEGQCFTVEYAIQKNGNSESKAFIELLDLKLKAKIIGIIKRFAEKGKIYNKEQFRKVEGKLFEFKHYQTRVIMYHCSKGRVALTHGFIKKTKNTPREEIERASRIMAEYDDLRKGFSHEQ